MKHAGGSVVQDNVEHHVAFWSHRLRLAFAWAVVLLFVALILDRAALVITEHRLASRVQTAERLPSRPQVRIHGFPFLTQVVRGNYGSVTLRSPDPIVAGGIRVNRANATLKTVRVRVADAVHGTVPNVPVMSGRGSATIPYSSVNAAVSKYGGTAGSLVQVKGAGSGRATLVGPLGLSVAITARVTGGKLMITPSARDLEKLPEQISRAVSSALADPIPLPSFPFNVRLVSGSFELDGLHLTAVSHDSVFPVR